MASAARGLAGRAGADHGEERRRRPLPRQRCPEGSGRKAEAVADARSPINGHETRVLAEAWVLEPVIHDHHRGARRDRGQRGGDAVVRDVTGRRPGQEQRLVADVFGQVTARFDARHGPFHAAHPPPPVAARHEGWAMAAGREPPRDRNGGRGLAGAADDEVADAEDRNPDPRSRRGHAARRDRAIDGSDRRERQGRGTRVAPPEAGRRDAQSTVSATRGESQAPSAARVRAVAPAWSATTPAEALAMASRRSES